MTTNEKHTEIGTIGCGGVKPFVCPSCGGSEFGRDTNSIGGRVVALEDVRCHAPGGGWHGEWIDPTSVSLLAERDALRRALDECVCTIEQYVQYADAMTKRGMGHEPMSRSGFSPEYLLAHVRAALAQGEKGGSR